MAKNEVRIIGGKWRGRKLKFPDAEGLRPSQDRNRETLFNWLMPWLQDAVALDLFAGSGALGFEALSRGAAAVELVDTARAVNKSLQASKAALAADNATIIQRDALQHLRSTATRYDLVFVDPPFSSPVLSAVLTELGTGQRLSDDALVYVEMPKKNPPNQSPPWADADWDIYRDKVFGDCRALLLQLKHT